MRIINPQLWLSLGKEFWERNRGQNLKQIAASLSDYFIPNTNGHYIVTILIGYLPSVIQVKNAFRSWLLETYMPGGLNQQVFIYLDQFSSQARGLTYLGLFGLLVTTVMTLAVIEDAFNHIFKVDFHWVLKSILITYMLCFLETK